MSSASGVDEFKTEIIGVWASAAMETSLKEDGRTTFRKRVFKITPTEFFLLIDVFADKGGSQKVFTLEFWGPWHVGNRSLLVPEAFETEWGHYRIRIAPQSLFFIDQVLLKDPRTSSFGWKIGVPHDVSELGVIDILSIRDCIREYDITSIQGTGPSARLIYGERGFHPPAKPEQRLTKLSANDSFLRSNQTYEEHARASLHENPEILKKVAIIGTGNVGGALGRLFSRHGHDVTFAVRDPTSQKTKQALAEAPNIAVATIQDGVARSDVVILATPFDAVEPTLKSINLQGKILIDATNPVAAGLNLALGTTTSGAEMAASLAPQAKVLKAFNTIGANHFEYPMSPEGGRKDMFVCGDDQESKLWLLRVLAQFGFEPIDMGPLSKARLTEPLALVWISLAAVSKWGRAHAIKFLQNPHKQGQYSY